MIVTTDLGIMGTIYVKYNDLRETANTFYKLQCSHKEWIVQYIGPKYFTLKHQPQDHLQTSEHEGQMIISAFYHGQRQYFHIGDTQKLVKELLYSFGQLFSFDVISFDFPALICKVEFFDTAAVNRAMTQLKELKIPVGPN